MFIQEFYSNMHSIDTFVPQFTTVLNEILTFCQLQNVKISLTHHFDSNEEKLLMQLKPWRCKEKKKLHNWPNSASITCLFFVCFV